LRTFVRRTSPTTTATTTTATTATTARVAAAALAAAALVLLAAPTPAHADAARFEAAVPRENISLDETVELTVTLDRDGNAPYEAYRAPTWPDFDLLHTGTSEQMQMSFVNGRQSLRVAETHTYVLRPRKKGALTITPAAVKVNGAVLATRAITIHVAPPAKNAMSTVAPPPAPGALMPAPPPAAMRGDEELFVDARADKPKVYVGEQVTVEWRLYTASQILKYRPVSEPKHEDFWCEDVFVPQSHLGWDRQVLHGREYAVALLLKKALFPLKAGKLTITPLEAEATTMSSMFATGASAVRRSTPITIDVLPLPAAGRPPGFDAHNVGQLAIEASVDRDKIKAGEAVTLKLIVRGTGNLRGVKPPRVDLADWKTLDPTTRENVERGDVVRGDKTFTYLLMPTRGGALTIPPLEFAYFDPAAGKYEVARTQPIAVAVAGDPSKLDVQSPQAQTENVLGGEVRTIRNRQSVHSRVGERLWRGRAAVIALIAPPASWLLVLIVDALRRRLTVETARSKRRRARRTARKRLRAAEYHIKAQRPSAFFGECARVLYEHLEYRLGQKVEALTLAELRAHLLARGFEKETAEAIVKELENCEFARFAPSASGPGEMRAALRRTRTLLGWIEKARPTGDEKEAAA
jgi:BatD DUF11 like domain